MPTDPRFANHLQYFSLSEDAGASLARSVAELFENSVDADAQRLERSTGADSGADSAEGQKQHEPATTSNCGTNPGQCAGPRHPCKVCQACGDKEVSWTWCLHRTVHPRLKPTSEAE